MSDPRRPVWLPSEALRRHANRTATGDPEVDWLTHVRRRHLAVPPRRVLVLGAGAGFLELALSRHFPGARIVGIDGDAEAIRHARDRAARRGLARVVHEVRSLDRDPLPDGKWDAVFGESVLQRVEDPERLCRSVHDALAPDGRVVLSEFADVSDTAASPRWNETLRRFVRVLPIGLRFDPETGLPFPRDLRESPGDSAGTPAALEVARAAFVEDGLYRGGGGLLQPLLAPALSRNLRLDGLDERLLGFLGASERDLQARGLVADVFAIFVGRPRAASRMT